MAEAASGRDSEIILAFFCFDVRSNASGGEISKRSRSKIETGDLFFFFFLFVFSFVKRIAIGFAVF